MEIKNASSRAKIFQPFDALPGLRDLLRQKEVEHEMLPPPSHADDYIEELNYRLQSLTPGEHVRVTYFDHGLYRKKLTSYAGLDATQHYFIFDDLILEKRLLYDITPIQT